ncbi:MAG: gene transfer agent family protein [Rhizobiaceae bacterium]
MTVNRNRGEIEAVLDGKPLRLCLTLGALAELEDGFGVGGLTALVERLSAGGFTSRQLTFVIGAGLRGAGNSFTDDDVARMTCDMGMAGLVDIASALLSATFAPRTNALSNAAAPRPGG